MTLKMLSWNCHSIIPKKSELSRFLDSSPYDLILLSETWLKDSDSFNLPNFNCYRIDRPYGGVAIFINCKIPHSSLAKISLPYAEAISIKILDPSGDFTVTSLYCSPAASRAQAHIFFSKVTSITGPSVVAGDFNAKHQAWNNPNFCRKGTDLLKLCASRNFQIHGPDGPTLIPPRGNPSAVDFVISKMKNGLSKPKALNILSSDHHPISFYIDSSFSSPLIPKIFNYKKANWKKFRSLLNDGSDQINCQFPILNSKQKIDACIELFTSKITLATNSSIPKKMPYKFRYSFSAEVETLTRYRNHFRNLFKHTFDPAHKSAMNQLNRLIRQKTIKMNEASFSDKISNLQVVDNSLFDFSKALKKKKAPIPPLRRSDGSLAFSEQEKAEVLADNFLSSHLIPSTITSKNEKKVKKTFRRLTINAAAPALANCHQAARTPILLSHVSIIIRTLKRKKAPGIDGVVNEVIQNLPKKSVETLTRIFNACMDVNYFPDCWKSAKILPIPKPGKNGDQPSNHRPISLLSNLGKILERIILDRLNEHEESNNIFIKQQFGFRSGHSTVQQVLRITECASFGFNKNRSTGLALLDLEKAFDSVWHDGLVHKLFVNNYPLYLVKLIQSFLTNRTAHVDVNGSSSTPFHIPAGVPQGSILSPHLFNVYINDIPLNGDTQLAIYADDTALFCHVPWKNIKCVSRKLSSSLDSVSNFFRDWKIRINKSKTEIILFTKSTKMIKKLPTNPINFDGDSLQWKNQVTYLGVVLDQKLSFRPHIDKVVQKARNVVSSLYCLFKRNNSVPVKEKVSLYRSVVRPVMTYACPVFSNCPKTHFSRLQIQQNKVLRMAINAPWYTRNDDLHSEANIPTIREYTDKISCNFYHRAACHENELINSLGNYNKDNIGFRLKHRLPKQI
jgi:endonuclease/exonuclease/phosphatase family metal-dependent hydrolase